MPMVKKSITLTTQQDLWLKDQIASGDYGNESEVFRDLIRQRMREAEVQTIRQSLILGEQSGSSDHTVDSIWEEAQRRQKAQNG
ncbi:MAG: type II toxin-antitoxin system ParD family antitoxin [Vulcanimicrobiota bacterium]